MASQTAQFVSLEQYLEQEEQSVDRHEYWNGEMFAMAGGSPAHSALCANLVGALWFRLRASNCHVRDGNMRVRTAPLGLYSYADSVVSCGNQQFDGNTLLNPVMIAEVLSESSEGYDRGKKEAYRAIASFEEYLLVAQDRCYVEHHARGERMWTMREYRDVAEMISLPVLQIELPLAEVYGGVTLKAAVSRGGLV